MVRTRRRRNFGALAQIAASLLLSSAALACSADYDTTACAITCDISNACPSGLQCFSGFCASSATECNAVPVFTQMSAGIAHTCGVTANHDLYCWGDDEYGQLGSYDATTFGTAQPAPQRVAPAVDVEWSQVSAGTNHTCAISHDGEVYCWGDNTYAQLGVPASDAATNPGHVAKPLDITGRTSWVAVVAGARHTCAVLTASNALADQIYCWGADDDGQLGVDDSGNEPGCQRLPSALAQ